ncbi:unnamed protein product [Phytomonas sp. EM1]|nr:unnamed protein product [Phytomonas sp. EM1]|eukprot:CCW60198.1 unnamed protein product [Phytomonas sp. isolate EM1]
MQTGSTLGDRVFHPSINSSVGPSPSVILLDDRKGLQPTEKLVFANQTTNTGALINFTEIIYSDSMRGYRVYRREHQVSPFFRLLSTNNMLLLAASLSFLLSCVVHTSASQLHHLHWLHLSGATDSNRMRSGLDSGIEKQLKAFASLKLNVTACIFFWTLLMIQLIRAYRSVYVEEVLAIRGIGLQFTSFGVFNHVREKRFVDRMLIRLIAIHDAFYRYQPIFLLSSSIENDSRRLVYFSETLPRLPVLRHTLNGIRHVLYGEEEHGPSLADIQTMSQPIFGRSMSTSDDFSKGDYSGDEETNISDES